MMYSSDLDVMRRIGFSKTADRIEAKINKLECNYAYISTEFDESQEQIKKLKAMIDNGLGWEDMERDI